VCAAQPTFFSNSRIMKFSHEADLLLRLECDECLAVFGYRRRVKVSQSGKITIAICLGVGHP